VPAWRDWDERLAQRHQLIVFDPWGVGFSDQAAIGPRFQLESQLTDLHAVLERLGLERVALLAAQHAGPVAIAYAARNPERVSHLVLWCSYTNAMDYFGESRSEVVHQVLDKDWDLFTETIAHAQLGWAEADSAGRLAALAREHLTPEVVASFDSAARALDVYGRAGIGPSTRTGFAPTTTPSSGPGYFSAPGGRVALRSACCARG
jgi:pimeloyl-ACP methyl ester carboxylesterase